MPRWLPASPAEAKALPHEGVPALVMLLCMQVVGNTFLHQQEQPDTKVQLSSRLVTLPPCLPGQAAYQTLMLMNHGDTAVQFDMQGLAQSPGLSCKPERSANLTATPHHALSCILTTSHLFQTSLRMSLLHKCRSMATLLVMIDCDLESAQACICIINPSCHTGLSSAAPALKDHPRHQTCPDG